MKKILVLSMIMMVGLILWGSLAPPVQAASFFLSRGISFGTVVPNNSTVKLKIDATGAGLPVCDPESDCQITGGHCGIIQFYGLTDQQVIVTYGAGETPLTSGGRIVATLISIDKFSDAQPIEQDGKKILRIGGALQLDSNLSNAAASGDLTVSITLTIL